MDGTKRERHLLLETRPMVCLKVDSDDEKKDEVARQRGERLRQVHIAPPRLPKKKAAS